MLGFGWERGKGVLCVHVYSYVAVLFCFEFSSKCRIRELGPSDWKWPGAQVTPFWLGESDCIRGGISRLGIGRVRPKGGLCGVRFLESCRHLDD